MTERVTDRKMNVLADCRYLADGTKIGMTSPKAQFTVGGKMLRGTVFSLNTLKIVGTGASLIHDFDNGMDIIRGNMPGILSFIAALRHDNDYWTEAHANRLAKNYFGDELWSETAGMQLDRNDNLKYPTTY